MDWYEVRPTGATWDLWVSETGPGAPRWGRWTLPDGRDAHNTLSEHGPEALGVPVWWEQSEEAYGKRLRDWLWVGVGGCKLVSERLAELLVAAEPAVRTCEVDVRWRTGDPVPGYVGVLEPVDGARSVHSFFRGHRVQSLQVSAAVRETFRTAGLTGLEVRPAEPDVPFTGSARPEKFSPLPPL